MRDFLNELWNGDSLIETLKNNRSQAVKLAIIAVVLLTVCLLLVYQGEDELQVTDAAVADESGTEAFAQDGAGASSPGDQAQNGSYGDQAQNSSTGDRSQRGSVADGNPGDQTAGIDTDGIVYIDIGGAVKQPMLAELPAGSRVEDAIQEAGGLTRNADLTYINRAELLTDGQKIYIPRKGEDLSGSDNGAYGSGGAGSIQGADGSSSSASDAAGSSGSGSVNSSAMSPIGTNGGKININTADIALLQQLTGIGPVTAQKIVDYREQNGRFGSIEEIKNVSGIGDKTFEKLRDDITI